jgi:phosphoribosylglycinamide formyltransferase-1
MTRLAFLCSGGGGNLRFVHHCIRTGILEDLELVGILTDRVCGAFEWGRQAGLRALQVDYSRAKNEYLLSALRDLAPDVIVTTFDRILDSETVAAFEGKMLNLHYSLLPAFPGTVGPAPVRLALERGCRILGTTVHRVVPEVDSGPILAQSALAPRTGDPFESTLRRIFRSGAVNLAGTLSRFGAASPDTGADWSYRADLDSIFSPPVGFTDGVFDQRFWAAL